MLPPAPSQPRRVSLKQTVWTSDGVAIGRQCCPPSLVPSSTPPAKGGLDTPAYGRFPPATAKPSCGLTKCTARMAWQGSGRERQCAPPSVVARNSDVPVTQPCLASAKSTVPSCPAGLVRNWITQWRPPAAPQERFGDGLGERSPCCFAGGADCPTGAWAAVPHPAASMAANPSMSPVSRPGALVDRGFITSVTALAASTLSP